MIRIRSMINGEGIFLNGTNGEKKKFFILMLESSNKSRSPSRKIRLIHLETIS